MPSEESYKKIEGNWKDFHFRRVQPSDHSAIFEQIANQFSHDEPTSKLLGWSQDFADDFNRVVEILLAHEMSFIVEHRETKKVAGLRINFHHTPDVSFESIPINSHQGKTLLNFMGQLEGKADVANKFKIDSWAEFFIASTSRDFRNQGIAGEFYDRSIEFLRAEGYKHALATVSSPFTRKATQKRNFEQVTRMDYTELMGLDGKPAFKDEDLNEDHFVLVMIKEL